MGQRQRMEFREGTALWVILSEVQGSGWLRGREVEVNPVGEDQVVD